MPVATRASSPNRREKESLFPDPIRVVQPSTPRRLKIRKRSISHHSPAPSRPHVQPQSATRPMQRPEVADEREKRMRMMEKDVDADEFNAFIDYISRFVRQATKEDRDVESARMLATSNLSRISELRQRIEIFAVKGAIRHVEPKLLSDVINILQTRIAYGTRTCSKLRKRELSKTSSSDAMPSVLCASTILSILCAPGCARSLLVEELLEAIVTLLEEVCVSIIFPICDPLYTPSRKSGKQNKSKKNSRPAPLRGDESGSDEDSAVEYAESNLKRRRSGSKRTILKRDEALFDQVFVLLDALSTLHSKEHFLPHSVASRLARVCVHSLSVTGVERFQSHAINTVCTVFASYPDHRIQILDGVREAASSVPAARRHLRCFKIAEDQTTVRASSALFAQLVCIASSDPAQNLPVPLKARTALAVQKNLTSVRKTRHGRALKAAVHVLDPLLVRLCSDRDPEYRAAFSSLLEDLLVLYGRPEWPSAELILQTLSVAVITRFRSPEDKTVHTKCMFLDILGSLASRMCALYGIDVLKEIEQSVSFDIKVEVLEMERETLLLYLDPKRSLQVAAANSFYDALFLVDDHKVAKDLKRRAQIMNQERNMGDPHDDEEVIDGQDGCTDVEKSAMTALEEVSGRRAESVAARRMRNEEITRSAALRAACFIGKNRSFTSGFGTILQSILDGLHDSAPTVRAKSIKALSSVDNACRGLLCHLPNVLSYIEDSCRDVSTLARDAALDLISRSLLQQNGPEQSISLGSLKDSEKRDPVLMSKIFAVVEKRLCDTATSVRKRAISIMRSILWGLAEAEELRVEAETPIDAQARVRIHEARIVQICTNLVSRLEDPEMTVKEAAERTLRLGLFGFDISQERVTYDPSDTDKANQLANRLIAVFARLPQGIHAGFLSRVTHRSLLVKQKDLLASILNAAVERFHESEAKAVSLTGDGARKDMTTEDHAELRLLSTEKVACSSIISAFAVLDPTLVSSHCRALAPAIKGVGGKLDNNEIHCIQRVLKVLEIGVGTAKDIDTSFVEEVMHDIDIIVCTSPVGALEEAAVKCFCAIARKSGLKSCKELVHRSASAFRIFLSSNMEKLRLCCARNMPAQLGWVEKNARFALTRLGLLARYAEFEPAFVEQIYETLAATSEAVAVTSSRDVLARSAIRGLSHFLIHNRCYLQKGTRILINFLETLKSADEDVSEVSEPPSEKQENLLTSYSEGVQFYVLQGFHDLLRDEEERNSASKTEQNVESRKRRRTDDDMKDREMDDGRSESSAEGSTSPLKPTGNGVVLAAEEDTEAGFLALSAQLMVPYLQRAVLHSSNTIRRTVANIFGLLVRQGLLLPATVVTSLFILLLDKDLRCRELACRVVNFLADRHSGMFASAALPALRTCFEASFDLLSVHNSKQSNEREDVRRQELEIMQQCNESDHVVDQNRVVDTIISMAVDRKSGMSLLSQAVMSMRREQRRGVLECIMKEFDPRVSVRLETPNDGSNETMVIDDDSGAKLANGGRAQIGSDDDEDVGQVQKGVVNVYGPEKLCALPTLYFLAITIACIDYTNGAGIGGSLTQGGGTAAAEAKLKIAKEDVSELVAIATRIVSNSGQAVLQVTKQLLRSNNASAEKWRRLCMYATRMSLLLSLKQHLKFSRWKAAVSNDEGKIEADGHRPACRLPSFRPNGRVLELLGGGGGAASVGVDGHDERAWRRQLEEFCKLMREDAIDEAEVRVAGRKSARKSKGGGGGRRRSSKAGAVGRERRVEGASARKYRLHRRASMTKVVYAVDSNSDNDSDYRAE
ncbi:Sister chromatid cohesion protein [Gracilaria domingensis]|nr:Sister chromatid cohesion protein [Gracilaria domingensis]